jgi:hypothetical protein
MKKVLSINILFADKDNDPILKGRGWISYFEKFLFMMLKQTTDHPFQIHMLSEGNQQAKILQSDFLIPVFSTNFMSSGICLDHLESFLSKEINPNHKITQTVMKVFKSPVALEDEPHKLRHINGYHLYLNEENNKKEISEFFGFEAEKNYWMKMVDLCFDIYEAMIFIASENKNLPVTIHKRKSVYLADTGQDISGARNIIKRELLRYGYDVYPKIQLPLQSEALADAIKDDLANCEFSIHLFGSSYGELMADSAMSITALQNSIAAEKAAANPHQLKRLIWISPSLRFASEKQKIFIHNLQTDSEASAGAEILETSYEDFKNTVWEQLLSGGTYKNDRDDPSQKGDLLPVLYLIYDPIDQNMVQPVIQLLMKNKVEVITPAFKGGLMELRSQHINALQKMDAAIVYQHFVNPQWAQIKLLDLLKAPGFGRNKPMIGKLFLTPKAQSIASEIESQYEVVVDNSEKFKKLDTFIVQIEENFKKNIKQPS